MKAREEKEFCLLFSGRGYLHEYIPSVQRHNRRHTKHAKQKKMSKRVTFALTPETNQYNQLDSLQAEALLRTVSTNEAFVKRTPVFMHDDYIVIYPSTCEHGIDLESAFHIRYHYPVARTFAAFFVFFLVFSYACFVYLLLKHLRS